MNEFSYYNIFDTKGIEYLIVIAFLLLLIPVWKLMTRKPKSLLRGVTDAAALVPGILNIPQGITFNRNHTWSFLEKSGQVKLGLDDFLAHITGEMQVKFMKEPGDNIRKGELIASLAHNDKSLNIFSPITGKIEKINHSLSEDSELLRTDPCGKGWIYSVQPSNWIAESSAGYLAREASEWFRKEYIRYKDFLSATLNKHQPETSQPILQDGGEIAANSLSNFPRETWLEFQNAFLGTPE